MHFIEGVFLILGRGARKKEQGRESANPQPAHNRRMRNPQAVTPVF
jgi:hypothetical protein